MSFYPDVIVKNIPPGENDPQITPIGLVLHVRDGLGDSLHDFFDGPSDGIESHWYIRFDGVIEQYRDTRFEADANFEGNSFMRGGKLCGLLSVETEGLAAGKWTDDQMVSLKWLMRQIHEREKVPLQVCPGPFDPGFGYHIMFGTPGPWTPSVKSCPGPERIQQFKTELVPWLKAGAPIEEDDMSADDVKAINQQTVKSANRVIEVVRDLAKAERERDARKQASLLAAVAKIPAGPEGSVDIAAVETAIRNVFADAATPDKQETL